MINESVVKDASEHFTRYCVRQQRYRVVWLVGPPLSGKTFLARSLRDRNSWHYIDFTRDPGYLDTLADTIALYQPEEQINALHQWCAACDSPVLIVDELDPLLATWSDGQRLSWASQASRMTYLPCGLVLVSHFFEQSALARLLPGGDCRCCLELGGGSR